MKINLYPKKIILIFLVILFSIFSELNAKNFDKKNVICADETGPLFEFLIPQFNNKLIEKDFKLKIYDSIDRQKSSIGKATIKKKIVQSIDLITFISLNSVMIKMILMNFLNFFRHLI